MNDRDRNAVGEGRPAQRWLAAPRRESRAARIVLIESPTWFRDCLAYTLTTLLSDVSIEGVNSVDEVVPGPAQLLLIGLDPRSGCEPAQLRDAFQTLRRVGEGSPIGAFLHADNLAVAASLATLGVAGIVMPSASLEIAAASVRLMAAGGTFLPAGLLGHRDETDVSARAAELSPPDVIPREITRPNELPLPLQNLTARERDVLKSLCAGRENKNIAFDLKVSESTVKMHLSNIMKKLHSGNRTQAAIQYCALEAKTTKLDASDAQSRSHPK
jgi:DNA-binding NarL/FixJ family response regulator